MALTSSPRRRRAEKALLLAAFVTAADVFGVTAFNPMDPLVAIASAALMFPLGFLLAYAMFAADARLWAWRRRRAVPAAAPSAAAPIPFEWSGRPGKQTLVAMVIVTAIGVVTLLTVPLSLADPLLRAITPWFALALVGLVAVAGVASVPKKQLRIDDGGIRVHRPLGGSFDLAWADVAEIGLAPVVPSFFLLSEGRPAPKMIVFRGTDGRTRGALNPYGELGPATEEPIIQALRVYAARHGVPTREVRIRDLMAWKRRKAPSL